MNEKRPFVVKYLGYKFGEDIAMHSCVSIYATRANMLCDELSEISMGMPLHGFIRLFISRSNVFPHTSNASHHKDVFTLIIVDMITQGTT